MSRYLINTETKKRLEYPVKDLIITKNYWEYFIFDCPDIKPTDDQQFAIVMGFETELGYISISELKPYTISVTKDLTDILPPEGYSWTN